MGKPVAIKEKDARDLWAGVTLIRGRVCVIADCQPATMQRAEEIRKEFEADWKGSIAKYNLEVYCD